MKKSATKDSNIFHGIDKKLTDLKNNRDVPDQTATINLLPANSIDPSGIPHSNSTNFVGADGAEEGMCSTTSFINSPSPYATIQVMRKHRQQQQDLLHRQQQQLQMQPQNGQQNLHHQRPHPGGFHTLKVTKITISLSLFQLFKII